MPSTSEGTLAALRAVLQARHLAGPDDLPELVTLAGHHLGAVRAVLYLVDYEQLALVPLGDGADLQPVAVDGTLAGLAFSDVVQHVTTSDEGPVLWTPALDGTDRLGVVQLAFPVGRLLDDELRSGCLDVVTLLAELVVTRSHYGDAVERARRRSPMSLPAELQWRLLPPLTFVSPRAAVAGVLAPADGVAGDSFDYALNDDVLHVALFDAMGHGLEATLLASVAVGALRSSRRRGDDLATTVRRIDSTLAGQFGPDRFVTGVVGELDTRTGWWRWVTCGHPPSLLVRGGRVVKVLDSVVAAPLGLELLDDEVPVGQERLEPGDRLVLYTDGVIEARDAEGEFFGTERLVEMVSRQAASSRPAAETLRRLNHAILAHQEGQLQDDATTVLVQWLTDEPADALP